jgi:hypothetical protein
MPNYTFSDNDSVTVKNLPSNYNKELLGSNITLTKVTFGDITIEKVGLQVRVYRSGKLLAELYAGKYVLPGKEKVEIHFENSPSGNYVEKSVGKAKKVYLGPVCKAEIHEGYYEVGKIRISI